MTRGAPAAVLEDGTALYGPDIDVGVRIGWTARMARLTVPGASPSMQALAAAVGTSASTLHRLERGQLRQGALLDRYEQVLGLRPGSLRAPVDVLCRTFPSRPDDQDASPSLTTVRQVSRATERLLDDDTSGGRWLDWARALAQPGAVGLPEPLAHALVTRLVSELGRSVGAAYPSRYEALALLRCSGYGHVVVEVAEEVVADRDVQVLNDLMSAVGEAVDDAAVAWCVRLLADDRDHVVVGAALALENMAQISADAGYWEPLAPTVVRLLGDTAPGTVRREWLSHLVRLMPRRTRERAMAGSPVALAPVPHVPRPATSRVNADWHDCRQRARRVTAGLRLPDQPVLARLLFDIAHSPLESRAVTAYMLLGALPALAGPTVAQLGELVDDHADPLVRRRAARRLAGARLGLLPGVADGWLGSEQDERETSLLLHGAAGARVERRVLEQAWRQHGSTVRAALFAAGMTGDPALAELAGSPRHPAAGGARWWLAHGPRVVEPAVEDAAGSDDD